MLQLDLQTIDTAAARLSAAAKTGKACRSLRDLIPADDAAAAYAVQQQVNRARVAAGARVVGRKIGLTSVAVQQQLGVGQPDFGVLFQDMQYVEGDIVVDPRLLQPRVEAEMAFVLAEDLDEGNLDLVQVSRAVDCAVAAIEVCDSRVRDWDITFADTVADNASAGGFVLGGERRSLADFVPRDVEMRMTVSGQPDSVGTGADCMGDPLLALQWLAIRSRQLGDPLRAGQVVLSGALGPMRPLSAGSTVDVTITGLGKVGMTFEGGSR